MLSRRPTRWSAYATLHIRPTRLRWLDLLRESGLSVLRHRGRTTLTALGTVLGTASFVATLGLSATLSQQVSASFDARRATEVVIRPEDTGIDPSWHTSTAVDRLRRLNGVSVAGRRIGLPESSLRRSASLAAPEVIVEVLGMDSDGLRATGPRLVAGRLFDDYHDRTEAAVVLLPQGIASRLGIVRLGVAVFIADRAYSVIGIFAEVERGTEALLSAIVPARVAERLAAGQTGPVRRDVLVRAAPGAAQLIGRQAPLALRPEAPDSLRAIASPDPMSLRREVEDQVARLSLLVSAVALVIGAVSIGNAATAGIAARVPEIGLRRAIGGRRVHIFAQLLAETTLVGAFGGLLGTLLGTLTTLVVSLWNSWAPVLDLWVAVRATGLAGGVGLLAGLAPAGRAIRIQPVQALQR